MAEARGQGRSEPASQGRAGSRLTPEPGFWVSILTPLLRHGNISESSRLFWASASSPVKWGKANPPAPGF